MFQDVAFICNSLYHNYKSNYENLALYGELNSIEKS